MEKFQQALKHLRSAKRIVAFTGSGISAESGIPTFRGSDGLWEDHRIEDVATPQAFYRNPELVWKFYLERRKCAASVSPNPAHLTFAKWQEQFSFVGIVTQNIDGLHAKSGSQNICELHGNLWKSRCTHCEKLTDDVELERSKIPTCTHCRKGILRPHIVWFGEALEEAVVAKALDWMHGSDIIFVVGTSGVVEPAASFVRGAKAAGAFVIEINLESTALSPFADVSLVGKSGDIMKQLDEMQCRA